MHNLPSLSLILLLLSSGLCLSVYATPEIQGSALNVVTASRSLALERWLEQKDLNICLSESRADILFAVDGSESVSLTDFHLVVKSLLVDTISRLEIGENFVQVGILVFSSQVTQVVPIGKFSSKIDLLKAVSQLVYDGSYTSVDAAIEGCIAELGRRSTDTAATKATDVSEVTERKRIVVFVTDGRHTNSFGVYMRDLLGQLHRRVTAVMSLGLRNSDQNMLLQLATDATLVFDPTAYPDYQASLHKLLNMRCSGTCYKYERQEINVRKVIGTLVQYVNYLIGNFVSYRKQELALVDYSRNINESVVRLQVDIEKTCNADDSGLLRRIVTLEDRIRTETNGSTFAGASIDAYVSEMIRKISAIQKEVFHKSQTLATEKTKLNGTMLEEERIKADFQARLESKQVVRMAQESSLRALEIRIETYRTEMASISQSISRFENVSAELSSRLVRQEMVFASRQEQLTALTQQHTALVAVQSGGGIQLAGISRKLAQCQAHMRDGFTVLFAIRSGSGAAFELLFSREDASYSEGAYVGLSAQIPLYKSPFLRQLHTMGYFTSVTWQFLDISGGMLGTITMDTSRFELRSLFSRARVTTSFPWVASYVNSIYSSSLSQFRTKADAEFLLVFGDLTRYHASGNCADIVGIFIVLTSPHRCFPDAVAPAFPRIYVSTSPFGGLMNVRVTELRLVTDRLPNVERPMPTRTTNDEQLSEVLLYVKAGAGYLHSTLLTSHFTSAALLADVDDLSQLARHYKSSMLANLNLDNYRAIKLELFDRTGRVQVALRFEGPFNASRIQASPLYEPVGVNPTKWAWFQGKYVASAQPFDLQRLRSTQFNFYNGAEFFQIGDNLSTFNCDETRYFLTLVDGNSTCFRSPGLATPAIYFSNDLRPRSFDRMTLADGLRLTGELVRPQVASIAAAAAASASAAAA